MTLPYGISDYGIRQHLIKNNIKFYPALAGFIRSWLIKLAK